MLVTGASVTIVGGTPVRVVDATTIIPMDSASYQVMCLGLASDSAVQFPAGGSTTTGYQAGYGYDYTNYDRGGLVGVFINGGVFELYDDGRGHPCDVTETWAVNQPVFASDRGILRNVSTTTTMTIPIGMVLAVSGTTTSQHVTVKMLI